MLKTLLSAAFLSIFLNSCAKLASGPAVAPSDYKYVAAKVFARVEGGGALSGTAFVYEGKLLTAGHVCEAYFDLQTEVGIGSFELRYAHGNGFRIGGLYVPEKWQHDDTIDLCVLRPLAEANHKLIELEAGRPPDVGDQISIVGAPLGLVLYRTDGYVSNVSDAAVNGYMTVSAPAWGGNSGSPVLDKDGRLVGMLVAGVPIYPIVSVVVPTWMIDRFLQ